jgi:decaprenylphospho-beta-D-ribofuranose 2-oxidase
MAGVVAEISVVCFALAMAVHAGKNRGHWPALLLSGMLTGQLGEYLLVRFADHDLPYYVYRQSTVSLGDVPLWVGVGWGLVLYAVTWTAWGWSRSTLSRALIAGWLAVSLDISLELAARQAGLWTWIWPQQYLPPVACFGAPFDNFSAWFGFAGLNALLLGAGMELTSRSGRRPLQAWVPYAAAPLTLCILSLLRLPMVGAYEAFHGRGAPHLLVLIPLLALAMHTLWRERSLVARAKPRWLAVSFTAYCHALSLWLVASRSGSDVLLLATIVINAGLAVILQLWPVLFAEGSSAARYRPPVLESLRSYSGFRSTARVVSPATEEQLRQALRAAAAAEERITFRAGGTSFDEQALGSNVVISLLNLKGVAVDPKAQTVQVGAGVTWGEIYEETLRFGLLPRIVVTTRLATAGGTLSSHSISRFTPTLGREGHHVLGFCLMMLDGTVFECSRSRHADLFSAVIGGLGYAGAVTSVTYALTPAPCAAPDLVVESTLTKLTGVRSMVDALLQPALEAAAGAPPSASSAVIHLHGQRHSLFATSRYASGTVTRGKRCTFHCPGSLGHFVLQLAAQSHSLRRIANRLIFEHSFRKPRHFVDEPLGYTFFQDGNQRIRRLGRHLGFAMGLRQQTFMIPCDPGDAESSAETLEQFLDEAQRLLDEVRLVPALIDILYVPADYEFSLSSSRALHSFAVTFTFERLSSLDFTAEDRILYQLSESCLALRGRVHLVKHVITEPATIERMYEQGLRELRLVRARHGLVGKLENAFSARVLPSLQGRDLVDAAKRSLVRSHPPKLMKQVPLGQ